MFEKPPITVLGVGNILLTDEGFGVQVIETLEKNYTFSDNVQFLDGGTMGMELLHYLGDVQKLLLVDAVHGEGEPGTVYEFRHEELNHYFDSHVSVHEVGIQDILRIRYVQEKPFEDAVVIGAEPLSLDIGLALTEPLQTALQEVVQRVVRQLEAWGVEVSEKHGSEL